MRGVGKVYRAAQGTIEALRDINLTAGAGEFLCILGPSGCGKSTLLRILAGLSRQTSGEVVVQAPAQGQRPESAVVFQEYALFSWRTVRDNIAFGLQMRGLPRREREAIADHDLVKMGLTPFAHYYPHQLSGGMKQRVALARALAYDPEILLWMSPLALWTHRLAR